MTKPLVNHLKFDWKSAEIKQEAEDIIRYSKSVFDQIGSLSISNVSPGNVIGALNDMSRLMGVRTSSIDFVQHVSDNQDIRDASREAEKVLSEFWVESSMRTDVFERLCELQEKVRQGEYSLSTEEKRYLDHEVLDGHRNGLHLGPEVRSEVEEIKKRLSQLSIDFSSNIAEDKSFLFFTEQELAGCQDDLLEGLEKDEDGKYKVTLQYPHYIPVMRDCTVRDTRRALELKYNSRCKEVNLAILREIVDLRDKKARILGYKHHADFMTEKRMAKTSEKVATFLSDLRAKIDQVGIAEKDKNLLRKYRLESMGIPTSAPFENCDTAFLRNLVERKEFSVDHVALQQYFPLDHVVSEMLNIYGELLDLEFAQDHDQPIWHPDVVCYLVKDRSDSRPIGYFYMDMFPREGKFSHAALFPLQANLKDIQIGVCSLVCNFTKPTATKPSLLTHDEVTTTFHEMGHCLHHLCAEKVTIVSFAGTEVERDFVECPSQMLENWCWEKPVLKRLSRHSVTGEPLPDDLIDSLAKSRNANEGISTQRQIAFALFDQVLHSGAGAGKDITQIYFDIYGKVTGIAPTPGTCMPASFGHLCGYDASYYSYLWAEVFAADLYVTKFAHGNKQFSKVAGKEYRENILGPGGSIDAADMLREYLGREPSMDAFFQLKGIITSAN